MASPQQDDEGRLSRPMVAQLWNPMQQISCAFTSPYLETAFQNEYTATSKPYDTMTLGLSALVSHLPRSTLTNTADIVLRATLCAWAGLSTAAAYRTWRTSVLLSLRMWFAALPLVLLYAMRQGWMPDKCPRSFIVAVVGNSLVYALTHHLPFYYHAPCAIVGFVTSSLLIAAPGGCCAMLTSDSSDSCSTLYNWVMAGVGKEAGEAVLRGTCARMVIGIQGVLMTLVSTILLWWELHLRKTFLAQRAIPTTPYAIYLVLLRWVGVFVFLSYQFTMLASVLVSA